MSSVKTSFKRRPPFLSRQLFLCILLIYALLLFVFVNVCLGSIACVCAKTKTNFFTQFHFV